MATNPKKVSKFAAYLTKQIDALAGIKSQREIAEEMGLPKPNVVSMYRSGATQVPLERIPALAKAIDHDPALLFRLRMEEIWPEGEKVIGQIFGTVLTANERSIIEKIRKVNKSDPALTPDRAKQLAIIFKE